MSQIERALLQGFSTAVNYMGKEVIVYFKAWTSKSAMVTEPRWTEEETARVVGVVVPIKRENEPALEGVHADVLAVLRQSDLPRIPKVGDRFAVSGLEYNIVKTQKAKGAVVKLFGAGPTPASEGI